jgi:hypothetical protein
MLLMTPQANTIRAWIMAKYEEEKALLRAKLRESLSSIHISFDFWTSTNQLALMAVVAHYVDADFKI